MDQRYRKLPELDLSGRVAVIAGGGSAGMGRATAMMLSASGARIAIIDINREAAEESANRVREIGGEAICCEADMTVPCAVEEAMSRCVRELGGLNILFNNTGVPAAPNKLIADFEPDEWDRSIQLNLKSIFLGMKYAIPHMLAHGGGAIVNNASVSGLRANIGGAPYGVAKAGVIHLTKVAALEYGGRGIRVNAVCPYSISRRETLMSANGVRPISKKNVDDLSTEELDKWRRAQLPMLRSGLGFEVASAVRFLVSDAASWVSGAALPVDGASAAGFFGSFR